jgi:hypothetical protein
MYSIIPLTYSKNTDAVPPGSSASSLNKQGDVVGDVSGALDNQVEIGGAIWFHYDAPFFTAPSMSASGLNDINDSGVAAGRVDGHAVLIDKNGTITDLSVKVPGAQMTQEAYAINNSGLVCAGNDDGQPGLIIDSVMLTVKQGLVCAGNDDGQPGLIIDSVMLTVKQVLKTFVNIADALPLTINDVGDFAGTCTVNGDYSHGFGAIRRVITRFARILGPISDLLSNSTIKASLSGRSMHNP